MGGALLVTSVTFKFILKRSQPIFEEKFRLPTRTEIDLKLIMGAMLFGLGWGMAGFCPGPAIASLGLALLDPVIFIISMIVGFWVQKRVFK
jgi:uncharacterized membrane protein YedE/YeeE